MPITELWIGRVGNTKTDDVPTVYLGATKAETAKSCLEAGCPLLPVSAGGPAESGMPSCYYWGGTPRMGHASAIRAYNRGKNYSLYNALKNRNPNATMVRNAAGGDPKSLGRVRMAKIDKTVREAGLALVVYSQGWSTAEWLKPYAMASTHSLEAADEAVSRGWRATVVLPDDFEGKTTRTPEGRLVVVCPAQQRPGAVTCNTCRVGKKPLCDATADGPIIGFIEHGPGSKARRRKP